MKSKIYYPSKKVNLIILEMVLATALLLFTIGIIVWTVLIKNSTANPIYPASYIGYSVFVGIFCIIQLIVAMLNSYYLMTFSDEKGNYPLLLSGILNFFFPYAMGFIIIRRIKKSK